MLKRLFSIIAIIAIIVICGCDSGVKPNYFIGMFRDEGDIDRLSECLSSIPEIDEEGNIIIKANRDCLVDLSNQESQYTTNPRISANFNEILNDPISYLDRIVTFQATIKALHHSHRYHLYTNRNLMDFDIHAHGADVYVLDENGEETDLQPQQEYEFTVAIVSIAINDNKNWTINANFIITENKEIVYQPTLVEAE